MPHRGHQPSKPPRIPRRQRGRLPTDPAKLPDEKLPRRREAFEVDAGELDAGLYRRRERGDRDAEAALGKRLQLPLDERLRRPGQADLEQVDTVSGSIQRKRARLLTLPTTRPALSDATRIQFPRLALDRRSPGDRFTSQRQTRSVSSKSLLRMPTPRNVR